jgi:Tfp pilus assembly protein PilF
LARQKRSAEEYLRVAPKDFDALHLLRSSALKGEYEESERLFRETTSLDPNFHPAFINYGSLLAKQKKYIDAVVQFDISSLAFSEFAPAHCDRGSL